MNLFPINNCQNYLNKGKIFLQPTTTACKIPAFPHYFSGCFIPFIEFAQKRLVDFRIVLTKRIYISILTNQNI